MRMILPLMAACGSFAMVLPARHVATLRIPGPAAAAGAAFGVVAVALGLPWTMAIVGGGCLVASPSVARAVRTRREAKAVRRQWPDFLAMVRSRIGSGDPLPDAVRLAARSLGGPFSEIDGAFGGTFSIDIEAARRQWADPIADRVLTTLRVATAAGAAHDAALTQQRLTAGVALVSPWLILALSLAPNPQAATEFASPTGHAILVGGLIAISIGFGLARRSARLAQPPRVFE